MSLFYTAVHTDLCKTIFLPANPSTRKASPLPLEQGKTLPTGVAASSSLLKGGVHPSFLAGFAQADGCFHISYYRAPSLNFGFRVVPVFTITQKKTRSSTLLPAIHKSIGEGQSDLQTYSRDSCSYLRVRGIKAVCKVVIPLFDGHPLLPEKGNDYHKFREVVVMMALGEHLTPKGWRRGVEVAYSMNSARERKRPASELLKVEAGKETRPKTKPSPDFRHPAKKPRRSLGYSISHYVSGVVQGDGGFAASYRSDGRIDLSFYLGMSNDSIEVMEAVRDHLGCGRIYSVSASYSRLMVTSLESLAGKVLPHFRKYPLWDEKRDQCEKLSQMCDLLQQGRNHTLEDYKVLVGIGYNMNMEGSRRAETMEHLIEERRKSLAKEDTMIRKKMDNLVEKGLKRASS